MGGQKPALESLVISSSFWPGKRVLVTGHTGFKGGWLALWLQRLGARVMGYSLPAPTQPSLFETARISESVQGVIADIRDLALLKAAYQEFSPEIVFHLAAQSLVRASYDEPVETYSTNLLGTVHVLEAVRLTKSVRSAVIVTTDKCYENHESDTGYRETDRLGGHDPYSNSKACAELATDSYRRAFLRATARRLSPRRVPATSSAAGTGHAIASFPIWCAPRYREDNWCCAIRSPRVPGSTCWSRSRGT